jgi:membrane protein
VLLLWIYLSAVALLVGAELNAEIEKMWPTPDGPYAEDGDDQAKLDVE